MSDPGPLLRAVPHQTWAAGVGRPVLVRHIREGRVGRLTPDEAATLAAAARFVPAAWLAARLGPDGARRLAALEASGWFDAPGPAHERLRAAAASAPPPPTIAGVLVPTRGPSPELQRLLHGLAETAQEVRPVCVLVDSPDARAAEEVRVNLPMPAWTVIGAREREAWEQSLIRRGAPMEGVRDALEVPAGLPWRVGALRNLGLLIGVDQVWVSIDDDVVPEVCGPPRPGPALLASTMDPTTWWAAGTREQAWAGAGRADLAALHAGIAGANAAGLVVEGDAVWLGASATLAADVEQGARVVVSSLGIAGDGGISRASTWVGASPEARARMLAGWPNAFGSRAMRRLAAGLTLTDARWLMAPCLAMDGSALLPPFLPLHRNTDGLMATCLMGWVRPGLVAHLPWAVRHDPAVRRSFVPEDLARDVVAFRVTDLLTMHLGTGAPRAGTPEDRLAALAQRVDELARAPLPLLRETAAEHGRTWLAGMAGMVATALGESGPAAWTAALVEADRCITGALAGAPFPAEHGGPQEPDVHGLRADLRRFASALSSWTALREAARGVTVAGRLREG